MRGGFLLEDGRVAEDAVADAAELVVYGLADGLAVVVSGQRFSEFAPFETEFADFIGQIAPFGAGSDRMAARRAVLVATKEATSIDSRASDPGKLCLDGRV